MHSFACSEKVLIPETKPFIFVRGNGKGRTSISFESASPHNAESATFAVHADNVIVFGLSFRVRSSIFTPSLHCQPDASPAA
jgi:hypothetical protein